MRKRLNKKKINSMARKVIRRQIEIANQALLYIWGDTTVEKGGEFVQWSIVNNPDKW